MISIIVPIHNLERYIERCIESIIHQTYRELEIILVNDGSTDASLDVCRKYEALDDRITVIDKECGGVSDARNAGIRIASGEYIFLLDGDDYILKNTIELLYHAVKEYDADLAIFNYQVVRKKTKKMEFDEEISEKLMDWKVLNRDEAFEKLVSGKPYYALLWNKLYKRSIFENLLYPYGKINEDEFVAHLVYGCTNKAIYTEQKLYMYVQHENSIMANYSMKRHHKAEAFKERIDYLRKVGCSEQIIHKATVRYLIEEFNFNYNIRKMNLSDSEKNWLHPITRMQRSIIIIFGRN